MDDVFEVEASEKARVQAAKALTGPPSALVGAIPKDSGMGCGQFSGDGRMLSLSRETPKPKAPTTKPKAPTTKPKVPTKADDKRQDYIGNCVQCGSKALQGGAHFKAYCSDACERIDANASESRKRQDYIGNCVQCGSKVLQGGAYCSQVCERIDARASERRTMKSIGNCLQCGSEVPYGGAFSRIEPDSVMLTPYCSQACEELSRLSKVRCAECSTEFTSTTWGASAPRQVLHEFVLGEREGT
jgi:endogenous inhibitor of DNA gyrase (YacG/DUF329 family)